MFQLVKTPCLINSQVVTKSGEVKSLFCTRSGLSVYLIIFLENQSVYGALGKTGNEMMRSKTQISIRLGNCALVVCAIRQNSMS